MTDDDYAQTLDSLDRILNDPSVPMRPEVVWQLLEKLLEHDSQRAATLARRSHGGAAGHSPKA